jgi:hypothetical protein
MMNRGRPAGSVKPEHRQRRDYRFSQETLRLLAAGRELTASTETALVEAAIAHYVDFLTRKEAETRADSVVQPQPVPLHFAGATRAHVLATQTGQIPAPASLHHRPTYQIFLKHAPGACPALPAGLAYCDQPVSIEPRQCPIHRVFAQPCTVAFVRGRVEQLKAVAGITHIWPDKNGQTLARDCWRKEGGRWLRDD